MDWDAVQRGRLVTRSRGRAWLASLVGGFMFEDLVVWFVVVEDLDDASRSSSSRYRPSGTFFQRLQGCRSGVNHPQGSPPNIRLAVPTTTETAAVAHISQPPGWLFSKVSIQEIGQLKGLVVDRFNSQAARPHPSAFTGPGFI